jgi:MoxR-like ATPase
MKLFVKENNKKIHGQNLPAISEDLYYALKLNTQVGNHENISAALGEHENLVFAEVRTDDVISMAVIDKKRKTLKGFRMNPTTRFAEGSFSEDNFEDRVAVLSIILRIEDDLTGTINRFAQFEAANPGELTDETLQYELKDITNDIESAIVTSLYSNKDKSALSAIQKPPQEINISQVETGLLMPSKVIFGQFVGFKSEKKARKAVNPEDIKGKFVLNPTREYTDEEKMMIYQLPKHVAISANAMEVAELVKASRADDPHKWILNILFEGPAGTGKTQDAKTLSYLFDIPYTKITCFSDMDSSDVAGAILPVVEDEVPFEEPSKADITFDTAGCYERLTGETLTEEQAAEITPADVYDVIRQKYEEFYNSPEGKSSPRYIYYASEIVKAFEFGYLCEIQEPTCIADAAVLMILNSAFEKNGVINLSQRTVKRHPECIFVVTTNRDYEGCRPLNEALRDRFDIACKVELPSNDEQVERLMTATDCTNEGFLRIVVESVNDMNAFLRNNGYTKTASLRGMQNFVNMVMRGFDVRSMFMKTIVYQVSTDDGEVAEIENFLELSTRIFSASL